MSFYKYKIKKKTTYIMISASTHSDLMLNLFGYCG